MDPSGRYGTVHHAVPRLLARHHQELDRVREALRRRPATASVEFKFAGGLFGILAAVNEAVENSYWTNLGLIFFMVFFCLYLTYGSLVAAALLMIPVILSQLAAEAMMVWLHIDMNVNSLPIAAAGAGVGVDYGIYHFSRMIDAYDEVGDLDEAVDYATATTGKAIIFTGTTMIAGTGFFWLSDLKFLAEMGLLLTLLMTFNKFGALIVVPALVKVIRPAFLLGRVAARRHVGRGGARGDAKLAARRIDVAIRSASPCEHSYEIPKEAVSMRYSWTTGSDRGGRGRAERSRRG